MIIKNGNIYTNKLFINGDIIIQDKIIKHIVYNYDIDNNKINESDEAIIDASDLYIIPGLVDIHFHGCKGHDFCEATFECLDEDTTYQYEAGIAGSKADIKQTGEFKTLKDDRQISVNVKPALNNAVFLLTLKGTAAKESDNHLFVYYKEKADSEADWKSGSFNSVISF